MGILAQKGKTVNRVVLIDVDLIRPNPAQPRTVFKQSEIESLAASIVQNGLLQPLSVRKCEGYYELISGERRLRAIKYALMKEAPCIVVDTTDRQSAILALLENIQREDLNYFEEALALKNLMVEWGISQQELGTRLGYAQPTIANKLRLLRFDEVSRKLILGYELSERQARALLKLEEPELLQTAVEHIAAEKLNVAQTEAYIAGLTGKPICKKEKQHKKVHPIVKDVRLFLNTINHAVTVMKQSGIPASTEKIEQDDCITYVVKIPLAN